MNLDQILARFLLNKSDQEELDQLHAWKNEAEENVLALQEMQKLYDIDMTGYESFDTDSALDKVEASIAEQTAKEDAQVFQLKRWIMSAAAVVGLLAATTFVWKQVTTEQYPTNYASTDTRIDAQLQDHTQIKLDNNSTLNLISEDFNTERALSLNGRAYFEVTKDADRPFTVQMNQGKITVLGTAFDLHTREGVEEVYVTEGHVRYDIDTRSFDLKAGQYIKVIDGDVMRVALKKPNYLSWKDGKLVLNDVPMNQALKDIADHFKYELDMNKTSKSTDCKITTTLDQETLAEAMSELNLLMDIKFEIEGQKLIINDISC